MKLRARCRVPALPAAPLSSEPPPARRTGLRRFGVITVRYLLPALLIIAGVVGIIIGHGRTSAAGAGVVFLGTALMVVLTNWMFSLNVSSNTDREREEAARDFFSEHGYWPGEGGK